MLSENQKIIIHSDGGSRGNPGPAAAGAVIEFGGKKETISEYLGVKTNNEAEYTALVLALKKTKILLGKKNAKEAEVFCYADSELMVRQLIHEYKVQNEGIQKLFLEAWNLMLDFGVVQFFHIPREQNKEADKLVNEALDKVHLR